MANAVSDSTFDQEVLKSTEPVLVDFFAEWCGPCKAMAPALEQVAKEMQGKVKVVKLDVDQNPAVTGKYGIRAMPTLILFKNGQVTAQHTALQVQLLAIGEDLDRVESKPLPIVDPQGQRQPVGEIHQIFVLDFSAGYLRGQAIVTAGEIRTWVVYLVCRTVRCRTAGGNIAITKRAKCFPEALLLWPIPVVDEHPIVHAALPLSEFFARHPPLLPRGALQEVQEVAEKLLHLITIPQVVWRRRFGGGRGHHDAEAKTVMRDGAEGIFIGHIITDIDRHHLRPIQT